MERTHLLCTFAHRKDLALIADYIEKTYTLPERKIFVFNNADDPNELYCTYNADASETRGQNTISIHRKKETNTLYTVNALNAIIRRVNNGVLDKTFQVDWNNYQNSFILTDGNDYRVVELVFFKKISWT